MCMRKYLIFLLLILGSSSKFIYGQSTWERLYGEYGNWLSNLNRLDGDIRYDSINHHYLFWGMTKESRYEMSLHAIDTNGNFISRNHFIGTVGQKLLFSNNNSTIGSDLEPISTFLAYKTLFKMDSLCNIIWKYRYEFKAAINDCGLIKTSSENLVLAQSISFGIIGGPNYPAILKTDSAGNLIWLKSYLNISGLAMSVLETLDKNYLMACNASQNNQDSGIILCKTDTSGNVLWAKSYMRPRGVLVDLAEKPNGNLIVAGITDTTFQTPYPKLFLMELDSYGNTVWIKAYGDLTYKMVNFNITNGWNFKPIKFLQTSDGGMIILTSILLPGNDLDLVLMKTDSTGNIEWEIRHGYVGYNENGINFIQTPDNGYFIVGSFYHSPIETGYYLLKTDSLGSVGCSENTDSIPVESLVPTDSIVVVTDSLILIVQNVASLHDTTGLPPDSLPGCFSVSLTEFYNLYYKPVAYPNPTTGTFHLKMPEGIKEEKNIFIYDLTGREVSSTLNTFQTEFDFTLHAKGIYLVKVLDKERTVVVKVVVM